MKILLFLFHSTVYNSKKYTPKRDPDYQARFELNVILTILVGIILMSFMNLIELWPWLIANWPYEYGHIHSRNWIAPTGVLAIIVWFTISSFLKKLFSREEIRHEMESHFNNKLGNAKAEKFGLALLYFMFLNIILGVSLVAGYWFLFSFCMLVWVGLELWVRKTFYWNTPQK